jgi:hypothetical protein
MIVQDISDKNALDCNMLANYEIDQVNTIDRHIQSIIEVNSNNRLAWIN